MGEGRRKRAINVRRKKKKKESKLPLSAFLFYKTVL